ncbi:MAG: copper resistance protein B [Exilibacterium sp.]
MKNIVLILLSTLAAVPAFSSELHSDKVGAEFMLDEFEYRSQPGENPVAWSAAISVGTENRQLWLISEGERTRGRLDSNELRAYYSHRMQPDWYINVGWRGDIKPEPERKWFLLGVEGSVPYDIGMAFSLYSGDDGDTAIRFELEREFNLARDWMLTPQIKVNGYGQNDPETGTGSGLADFEFAVRLAYELSPAVVPYIGAIWAKPYGQTADYARAEGEGGSTTQVLFGVSLQF